MRARYLGAVLGLAVALPAFAGAAPSPAQPKAAPPAAGAAPGAPQPPPPPTEAELKCQEAAGAAIAKLNTSGQFRTVENTLSDQGPLKITTDYILPNKMRQVVTLATDAKPVETIVVDSKAWSNAGEGWEPLDPDMTRQLLDKMTLDTGGGENPGKDWNCHGKMTQDGKELTAYIGVSQAPKDVSPGGPSMPENQAARYLMVDPATGLPNRGVFAKKDQLDKPIFKTVYSYPTDLKIEAPGEVK